MSRETVRTLRDRVNKALLGSDWETLNKLIAPTPGSSAPGAPTRGETITSRFRVTQVWVTDHGKWQLAAVQYTSLP